MRSAGKTWWITPAGTGCFSPFPSGTARAPGTKHPAAHPAAKARNAAASAEVFFSSSPAEEFPGGASLRAALSAAIANGIAVRQNGKQLITMSLDTTGQTFTAAGGTKKVKVSSNGAWSAAIPTDISWVSITPTSGIGDGEITVTYGDNPSVREERQTYFIVTAGAKTVQQVDVYVSQEPAGEVIVPEEPHNPDPHLSR